MTLHLPPKFVNSSTKRGIKLSAIGAVNLFIKAVKKLDGWSLRQTPAFDSAGSVGTNPPYFGSNALSGLRGSTPQRLGRWCIRYRSGLNVTIFGTAVPVGAELIRVYFDAAIVANITPTTNWSQVITPSGYADGQPIKITIDVVRSGVSEINVVQGKYLVDGIYTGTISMSGWVAAPAFAGTFDATKLNQLRDCCTWLLNRMNLIPRTPRLATIYQIGPFSNQTNYPIWWGTIPRNFTNEYVRVDVYWTNYSAVAMRWKLWINGSVAFTSTTRGPGTWYDVTETALTQTVGTAVELFVSVDVVDEGLHAGWRQSRWSITAAHTSKGAGYPYWVPPTDLTYGLYSATAINTTLNSIATQLNAIKVRVDATPNLWGRVFAQRRFISPYEDAQGYLSKRTVPNITRLGNRLVVFGRGVNIESGPAIPPTDPTKILDDYEFLRKTTMIDSDTFETKAIYLDTIPEIPPTVDYYLTGPDVYLAEEYLF